MSDYRITPNAPLTPYVVQIAVNGDGNPVIQILPRGGSGAPAHPVMPYPVAVPSATFPDAFAAREYAGHILHAGGALSKHYADQGLVFVGIGHTLVNGRRYAALRAPLPE